MRRDRTVGAGRISRVPVGVLLLVLLGSVDMAAAQGVATAWGAYSGGINLTPGQFAPLQVDANGNLLVDLAASSLRQGASAAPGLAVTDSNSAAYQGVVAITPGAANASAPLRGIGFIVTTAGNVTFTFPDGSALTIALQVAGGGFQSLPFAVTRVAYPASSPAAGTFWGLE